MRFTLYIIVTLCSLSPITAQKCFVVGKEKVKASRDIEGIRFALYNTLLDYDFGLTEIHSKTSIFFNDRTTLLDFYRCKYDFMDYPVIENASIRRYVTGTHNYPDSNFDIIELDLGGNKYDTLIHSLDGFYDLTLCQDLLCTSTVLKSPKV